MVGDAHGQRVTRRLGRELAEDLRDVPAFSTEGSGAGRPCRIVAEEVSILLHGRAAAGGVDDDRVHLGGFKDGDHAAGEASGLIFQARVDHESAAAWLGARDNHLAAFRGEDADGRLVDVLEEDLLNTAGEHANAAARRVGMPDVADAGGQAAEEIERDAREQRLHRHQALGNEPEHAAARSRQLLSPARWYAKRGTASRRRRFRIREGGEEEIAKERIARRRGILRSTCARVSSMSLLYWTPEGHAVMQAMQPRQLSMCRRKRWSRGASPCEDFFIM